MFRGESWSALCSPTPDISAAIQREDVSGRWAGRLLAAQRTTRLVDINSMGMHGARRRHDLFGRDQDADRLAFDRAERCRYAPAASVCASSAACPSTGPRCTECTPASSNGNAPARSAQPALDETDAQDARPRVVVIDEPTVSTGTSACPTSSASRAANAWASSL